jgi:hypothetical protein
MFHFVANLQSDTYFRGRGVRRFDAYLLSTDYYRDQADLARRAVRDGKLLAADNGNFDLISDLIERFEQPAKLLDESRKTEEQALGRYVRPGELSAGLSQRYRDLADDIAQTCEDAIDAIHIEEVVQTQFAMSSSYLIGMEDFRVAVLTASNGEPEYTGLPLAWYEDSVDKAIAHALDTRQGRYGTCEGQVFAAPHAINFDTARMAGRRVADAGLNALATGMSGVMRDRNYVDFRVADGQLIVLQHKVARPYVRAMEIISGMHLGFAETAGKLPAFHALGLGSPIMQILVGLFSQSDGFTATDSTAPIKDAATSTVIRLYTIDPAPRKLKAHRIAQYWLEDEAYAWRCCCPYCRRFNSLYPPHIHSARNCWRADGQPQLNAGHLQSPSPLAEDLPLLGRPSDPGVNNAAQAARIGHNHWIMHRLEKAIRKNSESQSRMQDWVAKTMDAYLQAPGGSVVWNRSAEEAWRLVLETVEQL